MARQMADVVFDLRNDVEVAAFCDEAEINNLAFTPDGVPTYTGHDMTGKLVKFLVKPGPSTQQSNISKYRFGLA